MMLEFSVFCFFLKNFVFKYIKIVFSEYMNFYRKKVFISSICTLIYTAGEFNNKVKDIKRIWKIFADARRCG